MWVIRLIMPHPVADRVRRENRMLLPCKWQQLR
jgi:hypothetical protein